MFKSKAQEAWAHTPDGEKALGGPEKVAEWDQATQGAKLPTKVGPANKYQSLPAHIHRVTEK